MVFKFEAVKALPAMSKTVILQHCVLVKPIVFSGLTLAEKSFQQHYPLVLTYSLD
ncbi:hypothetical protein IMPJCBKJ_02558 [Pseudoalteromonas sp. MB47]|nr:hypothetical protein [Pseudoalteromonas sp. MB47]